MKILREARNQVMGLVLLGALSNSAVAEAAGTLNVFQITQGYNNGPAVPFGNDNNSYWGFAFHNGKMTACWADNSGTVTSTPPAPVDNIVFGYAQINSPEDVVVRPNVVVSKNLGNLQLLPQVAIDPRDTNHMNIIAETGSLASGQTSGLLLASTTDGGENWKTNFPLQKNNHQQDSKLPIPLSVNNNFPLIAGYDSRGNLLIFYTASFAPLNASTFTAQFPFLAYLCGSTDHGKSFKVIQKFDPRIFLSETAGYAELSAVVGQDQVAVSMTLFNSSATTRQGHLFIVPIKGKGEFGPSEHIVFPDGTTYGNGFEGSMSFSPTGGLLIAQTDALINSHASCGLIFTSFLPKGAKEFPAATSFQPFREVGVGGSALYPPVPHFGTWPAPRIAYVYNGHHYGRVYMAYLDNPNVPSGSCSYGPCYSVSAPSCCTSGNVSVYPCSTYPDGRCQTSANCLSFPKWADTDIYIVYSDDDGKTWSTPFPIPKTNANTRLLPQLAVDQTTGNIGVGWLDGVNDPADINVQVFATVIPWNFFD